MSRALPSLLVAGLLIALSPASALASERTHMVLSGRLALELPAQWTSLGAPEDEAIMLLRLQPYSGYVALAVGEAAQAWAGEVPDAAAALTLRVVGQDASCREWISDLAEFAQDRAIVPGRYRQCALALATNGGGGTGVVLRVVGSEAFHASEPLSHLLASLAPPTSNAAQPGAGPDQRLPELVALAAQGRLTPRALRGFGLLPAHYDALALDLRGQGLDLYGADAATLESWLATRATATPTVPSAAVDALQALVGQLRSYESTTP